MKRWLVDRKIGMKNLYVVSADGLGNLFFQAVSEAMVLVSLSQGMDPNVFVAHLRHPSFRIRKVENLEELMGLLPVEFKVTEVV